MSSSESSFYSQDFSSETELISFLEKEKSLYADFILSKYFRTQPLQGQIHVHHIQPKHSNGTDDSWNLMKLTVEEHSLAHRLLYESYNNSYDYCAWCLMNDKTAEGMDAMRKQNQLKMKDNNVGFYNSEHQRELGSRIKKKREPYSRNSYIKTALKKGFVLQSNLTGSTVLIQPGECETLHKVLDLWLSHPELSQQNERWQDAPVKERFSLYTSLTRCLTGHRDRRSNKAVYSVAGWSILGIFL